MNGDRRQSRDPSVERAATVEVTVHLAVLLLVLLPVLAVLFPATLLIIAGTMILSTIAPHSAVTSWFSNSNSTTGVASAVALTAVLASVAWNWRRASPLPALNLRVPTGSSAGPLEAAVREVWIELGGKGAAPATRWYAAMDVSAYASGTRSKPLLLVSAGLWRAIVNREPIARAIVAHEAAHLKYDDPLTLRLLAVAVTVTRLVLAVTAVIGLATLLVLLFHEAETQMRAGVSIPTIMLAWARVLIGAATVLILLPLGWLAVRRQIGFITSLLEIRADVVAATWTSGLEQFTQAFAEDHGVVRSTRQNLINALLSPSLTHIPEEERLQLLTSRARLITPKLGFFTLSLLVVFLLPINFASPLIFGGAGNYLAMIAMAAAFQLSVVCMLIVGRAPHVSVNRGRLLAVAIASCAVMAMPRINLEPVSYLAMSWIAGFGGPPADWSALAPDIFMTLGDLWHKTEQAIISIFAIGACGIAFGAAISLNATSAHPIRLKPRVRAILPACATLGASLVAGYDSFRSPIDLPVDQWLA